MARNIAALGARCIFLGVVGEDDASRTLMRALASEPLIEPHLVVDAAVRPHARFVSSPSIIPLRADCELAEAFNAKTQKALIDRTLAAVPRAVSVVLSDYAKGTLTPRVIRDVIDAARKAGIPIIVDPKAVDYSVYRGAMVIKPPLLCTLLHGTVKPLDDNVVLYDPRSVEPGTSVVCHIGEGHLGCKARGDIYARIEVVD